MVGYDSIPTGPSPGLAGSGQAWRIPATALEVTDERQRAVWFDGYIENFVLTDLLAWRNTETPRPEVTYWRTASGAEVDVVIERKRKLLAVEVNAGRAPGPGDDTHLKTFCAEYGSDVRRGIVLDGGNESYWLGENILAVPWWRVTCSSDCVCRGCDSEDLYRNPYERRSAMRRRMSTNISSLRARWNSGNRGITE